MHYVVVNKYSIDGDYGVDILAVAHNEEELLDVFNKYREIEKEHAEEVGLTVYTDEKYVFDAGLTGRYEDYFTKLCVHPVK